MVSIIKHLSFLYWKSVSIFLKKRKIIITLNDKEYCFYYSCNDDATFQNLLEFFASLVPSLNICQCYHFRVAQYDNQLENQYQNIPKNSKISDYSYYLNNLQLFNNQNECQHKNNNFLQCKTFIEYPNNKFCYSRLYKYIS